MACILFWNTAVRVHDWQACTTMDVIRERISRILELREKLLSFQTGFNLVNAAVVCVILDSISGLEPSSVIIEPRCLKRVTVSSFYPFTLITVLMPLVLFVISLVFSALPCRRLWRCCRDAQLILPVFLPLLLSHRCHPQSGDWWLFCFQCWQCLRDLLKPPEGRPGMSDVSPLSGISGLSFDSTLLSPLLFFCLVLLPFLSFIIFFLLALSSKLFPENSSIFFVKR